MSVESPHSIDLLILHSKVIAITLLLFKILDFRKVYWSPRFVCKFVRLRRIYRAHRWSDRHDIMGADENRMKVKVKTFVKIR